jgi:carboxyl-terminal processing protease
MQNFPDQSTSYRRSLIYGFMIGIGLALVFAAGFFFRDLVDRPPLAAASGETGYALLDEVQALLNRHYFREQPEYTQRQYAAIRGMLASLNDPYTFFIDPPVAASESDVLAGTYGGIGVQVQRSEAGELVLYPFEDSPAIQAGIEGGDKLRAINGSPVDVTMSLDAIDQMLRGEVREGSGVEITVVKGERDEELTVFVPFAVINVPSVVWRVLSEDERLGYIQIMRFTARTPEEVRTALAELESASVQGLIIDMRNNTGGLLQESIEVADEFLDGGVIVYERNNRQQNAYNAKAGGEGIDLPLVVLVNRQTASGAELVAGAIQDQGRGILIGQQTYGKGTVQQIFQLSDQSSLHVTSSQWLTPGERVLDANGLQPDIAMIPDENGREVELGEAIRYLQDVIGG